MSGAEVGIVDREESFDVVIVGAGGTGLAAAAAASRAGARTVLLEKAARIGGTTRLAVGSLTGAGTRLQRAAGIEDAVADFHHDMDAFTADLLPRDNPLLRAMLAAEAGPTIDWLEELGVAFAGPYPEPPHRRHRMHNTIPGPRMIIARLEAAARAAGTEIRLQVDTQQLLTDAQGKVVGVACSIDGRRCRLLARRGVILATGDFSGNREMRHALLPSAAANAVPVNDGNLGEGHQLAVELGAVARNMDMVFGPQMRFPRGPVEGIAERMPTWPWLARLAAFYFMRAPAWMLKPFVTSLLIANMSPAEALFEAGALLLDKDGHRLDTAKPAAALAAARDATGYVVLDARLAERFSQDPHFVSTAPGIAYAYVPDYLRGRPDIARRFASAASLTIGLGMSAATVEASVAALGPGPFVVLGPVHAMLTTTEGGIDIDAGCRVLCADGSAIDGLYAAGCVGQGGLLLRGHGLHLSWVFTSGRIAGETAARQAPSDAVPS
jgi:fumarate reductase flavoprotein subunit